MTPEDFIWARDSLGMTNAELAPVLRVSGPRTLQKWASGTRAVPGPVAALLDVLLARPDLVKIAKGVDTGARRAHKIRQSKSLTK
jgi:DNA-binding transcriptional regulator YiaG